MQKFLRTLLFIFLLTVAPAFVFNASAQTASVSQNFSRNLTIGDFGSDVLSLQAFLMADGILHTSGPSGYFDTLTADAVAQWQNSVGLSATGFFGSLSRIVINGGTVPKKDVALAAPTIPASPTPTTPAPIPPTPAAVPATPAPSATTYNRNLTIGDEGVDVSDLQSTLIADGYLQVAEPTGYFGAMTSNAVAKWQRMQGLPTTGYFGRLSRTDIAIQTPLMAAQNDASADNNNSDDGTATDDVTTPTLAATPSIAPDTTSEPFIPPSTAIIYNAGGGGGGSSPAPSSVVISTPASTSTSPTIPIVTTSTASSTPIITPPATTTASSTLDTTPPKISITSPANNANVSSSVTIEANASDNVGVTFVQFTLDGKNLGAPVKVAPYQVFWNTLGAATGTHTIRAMAADAAGNTATAKPITVTVSRQAPTSTTALNYKFGMSVGDSMIGLNSTTLNQQLNTLVSLGTGWLRFDMEWDNVQPNNSSTYNWSGIDQLVAAANAHNIKILAILDYTPTWAESSTCAAGSNFCAPSDPALFAAYAKAAVQRYAPQGVSAWEIWNEPNNAQFWGPNVDCNAYTALLKGAYTAIKQVEPSSTVITGGLAPESTDGTNMAPTDFLSCIYAAGGQGYFDAVGDHPYSFPAFPSTVTLGAWAQMSETTPSLRSIMTANGDAAKNIWVTEFGTPTNGPDAQWYVTEAQQAAMMTDAFQTYSVYSWGGPFFWYTLNDGGNSTSTNENFFGVLRADGSEKPAYTTLQTFLAE